MVAKALSFFLNFPIHKGTYVNEILGNKRVEGVELIDKKTEESFKVPCDTVVMTGRFRPDSALILGNDIEVDPCTFGPVVDSGYQTLVPNIFAAGNILRGADMHDICALEGRRAAQSILKGLSSSKGEQEEYISIRAEPPIRYVVPQRILKSEIKRHRASWFSPGYSIQVAETVRNPILEASSNGERVWRRSYSRFIANTRIPLPVEVFDWNSVNPEKGIVVTLKNKDT